MTTQSLILNRALREAPEDPSASQRAAADPSRHVWVRASAGSGKTKVLVDRLLRLLLPDVATGAPGVAPDKILCLTFTKAGAAEMSLRLQKRLLEWSAMKETDLQDQLRDLFSREPDKDLMKQARQLFAQVLDSPSRLRVLTIHSFCQSVLGRFPVETGLSPDFKVIEEAEAADFLQRALHDNLERATREPDSDLGRAFTRLAISKNKDQLQSELRKLIQEPLKLQNFLEDAETLETITDKLGKAFGIKDMAAVSREGFCENSFLPRSAITAFADILAGSSAEDIKKSDVIYNWLSANPDERLRGFDAYVKAVTGKARGKYAKDHPDFLTRQAMEMQRIDTCQLAGNIRATADLLYLARLILAAYDRHKKFMGVMDYNDLIFNTSRLLSGKFWKGEEKHREFSTAWVLYKLDEGIDHILVDESQDTNPDQWDIITQLTCEYFSGNAKPTDRTRTLFVVGDEKQSIFSFQRADPAVFHKKRAEFAEKALALQEGFEEELIYSFRTTGPVLKLTDATFDDTALRTHIGIGDEEPLRHFSFRTDKKKDLTGSVELWPLVIVDKKPPAFAGWELPFAEDTSPRNASQILAGRIALNVKAMIEKGQAAPGDIMILMRTRSPLMLHIIRELKNQSLPVSGLDRIVLGDSLIVQDLLALCDFALLNDDSFSLAALLKSPFVGMDEETLMQLSLPREKASQPLWLSLQADSNCAGIVEWLKKLTRFASAVQPYEFLEEILTQACPADPQGSGYRAVMKRLGPDALEPLDEILGQALKLELQEIRTLQDFVAFQKNTSRDIKREMEEAGSKIRIMTVHASKGLEAPIVLLPDTVSAPDGRKLDTFLWPDKSRLAAPLWSEDSDQRSKRYEEGRQRLQDLQMEEYSRLLYVAMTRARDRLIVCGAAPSANIKPHSWYRLVENGFARLKDTGTDVKTLDNGNLVHALGTPSLQKEKRELPAPEKIPGWLRTPAPEEAQAPASFAPSKLESDDGQPALSPRAPSNAHRFRRGLATHKLLQILPDLLPERQEDAARSYLARKALGLPPALQSDILSETMKVLRDSIFAPVFAPGSLAEIPVSGEIAPGKVINGQIDRLVITQTEILIVDYKTNRPSPDNVSGIPAAYIAQLRAYAQALSAIYPQHTVKCALLWTDKPLLMPVNID